MEKISQEKLTSNDVSPTSLTHEENPRDDQITSSSVQESIKQVCENSVEKNTIIDSLPFSKSAVRRIARQTLYKGSFNDPKQIGITTKSICLLSYAAKIFLHKLLDSMQKIDPIVLNEDKQYSFLTRSQIMNTIMTIPRFRFAVPRLREKEIFSHFNPESDLSHRIALSLIETQVPTPIPFCVPHPPLHKPATKKNEAQTLMEETQNVEAMLNAVVNAHRLYFQTVPQCLKCNPSSNFSSRSLSTNEK